VLPALPGNSIALVLGTRPEVVKLAHVARLLGDAARIVHTGQHFDRTLSTDFLTDLGVGDPHVQLSVGGGTRGWQIGEATRQLDEHLGADPPLAVVVQGDTNAVLAGAIAANARAIPLVHVEAGLRSFDRAMPEEHNRVVADHLADLCCAPTEVNRGNLAAEGIDGDRVIVTGNTVVEALTTIRGSDASRDVDVLTSHALTRGGYVLATLHRPENVDRRDTLAAVLEQLAELPLPVLLPLHPRTVARVQSFGLGDRLSTIHVTEPLGYPEFLALAANCAFIVSDSGGIQEEASVLKRPVIVVRNSTERPEVLGTFAELVPPGPRIGEIGRTWAADLPAVHARLADVPSPYGDGRASERIIDAIVDLVGAR